MFRTKILLAPPDHAPPASLVDALRNALSADDDVVGTCVFLAAVPGGEAQVLRGSALTRVTFYHSTGCHLCERARETVLEARDELGFEFVDVDISGDPELEARYREWLPVVEIDGERAFVYHVDPDGLRRRLSRA